MIFEAFHIYFKKFFKVYIGIKKSCIFAVQNFEVIQVRKSEKNREEMANHKSSLKRIRSNNSKRLANRYYAKTMRNALRDIKMITVKAEAEQQLPKVVSLIDKLAKKGIIHRNKAANLKSGVMKKINNL